MPPSKALASFDIPSLADFFWIAGLDSQEVFDTYFRLGEVSNASNGGHSQGVDYTIEEDQVAEREDIWSILDPPTSPSVNSKQNTYHRMSRLSGEAHMSVRSLDAMSLGAGSNRSSTTIRPVPAPALRASALISDVDFENALKQFSQDRDSFFLDLNFTAGAVTQPSRPRPRPKTQKIVSEEPQAALSRGIGSVRKHMSFREMSSHKRQPSANQQVSVRTARRTSNYNSVIPIPEPLDVAPNLHPLRRKFEPVLLDRYPQKDKPEDSRRGHFPDYVPMFAFPNDITIVSADTQPRSTWHGFSMTAADNSRLHAICVTVWMPMSSKAAEQLEKRCEEWRRANMTEAERELAGSLAERLASETAKLSRLLTRLPHIPSGSNARETLEDEISAVEEKILMMTDMLRPLRHGAASKIEGLTDGDTGLWIPRAYGILGRDASMTGFWKEWLRAAIVPMSGGAILRIPPSSPKAGMWQPLERYVVNLCTEAPSAISSKTQVEVAIRELRLYARKEAVNELPGSRTTDLYPLFRALTVSNILLLFEYVLAESRIILLSSHTSMLHLVSKALMELIWPLKWAGVFIPVLPARLVQALDAPCPYLCGVERRYEKLQLPEDDFVLVDLDSNEIQSTANPPPIPRQQRRKLMSLLQLAAPLHTKFGVSPGPPPYAMETFPFNAFSSENNSIFSSKAQPTCLSTLVGLSSASFGSHADTDTLQHRPIFNAFIHGKSNRSHGGADRPRTASTSRTSNPDSPEPSPISMSFPYPPPTPVSRNDSGFALHSSLREKRPSHFDGISKRSSTKYKHASRKASLPFLSHNTNVSIGALSPELHGTSTYAPSTYAQSTIAASTVMPHTLVQPIRDTENTSWIEGHCLQRRLQDGRNTCSICDEKLEEGVFCCSECNTAVHGRCAPQICIVCPSAFFPNQIRAAFARFFASLFYTYRKYLQTPTSEQERNGMIYNFNMIEFLRSLPHETADYVSTLQQTQAFNEFISDRERVSPAQRTSNVSPTEASIALLDSIILSKRTRGRLSMSNLNLSKSIFSSRLSASPLPNFLTDSSEHLWVTASASVETRIDFGDNSGRTYRDIVTRVPAKLEEKLMHQPRMVKGVPRINESSRQAARKPLPQNGIKGKLNGLALNTTYG